MAAKLDYQWHLRQMMATRGMFSTTDLITPLAERGIKLSSSYTRYDTAADHYGIMFGLDLARIDHGDLFDYT